MTPTSTNLPSTKAPSPANLSEAQILRLAERAVTTLALEPGTDMDALVRQLGGRVVVVPWGAPALGNHQAHGSLRVHAPAQFDIFIPEDTTYFRRRELLAHELGHYFVHYPLVAPGVMEAQFHDRSPAEWEAGIFAAGLLLPSQQLRDAYVEFDGIFVDIADRFEVSVELVRARWKSAEKGE